MDVGLLVVVVVVVVRFVVVVVLFFLLVIVVVFCEVAVEEDGGGVSVDVAGGQTLQFLDRGAPISSSRPRPLAIVSSKGAAHNLPENMRDMDDIAPGNCLDGDGSGLVLLEIPPGRDHPSEGLDLRYPRPGTAKMPRPPREEAAGFRLQHSTQRFTHQDSQLTMKKGVAFH